MKVKQPECFKRGQFFPRLKTMGTPQHEGVEYRNCHVWSTWNKGRFAMLKATKAYGRASCFLNLHINGVEFLEETEHMITVRKRKENAKQRELESEMRHSHLFPGSKWVRPNGSIVVMDKFEFVCHDDGEIKVALLIPFEGAKRRSRVKLDLLVKVNSPYRPLAEQDYEHKDKVKTLLELAQDSVMHS